jgi:hypothetical protein
MTFNFLPKCKICGERHRLGQCVSAVAIPGFAVAIPDLGESSRGGVESRHAVEIGAAHSSGLASRTDIPLSEAASLPLDERLALGKAGVASGPRETIEVSDGDTQGEADDTSRSEAAPAQAEDDGTAAAAQDQGRADVESAPAKVKFDRTAYQRELMRKRRLASCDAGRAK